MPRLPLLIALLLASAPAGALPTERPARSALAADPPEDRAVPELIGGLGGLVAGIEYPSAAVGAQAEGRVVVLFVVDEGGRVADAVVASGVHPALDEAALRAVRAARFLPAVRRGRPVRVELALPITFDWPDSVSDALAPRPPVALG